MKKVSIRDISADLANKELLFGQFLDDFNHAETKEERLSLISEEPFFIEQDMFRCVLAAAASMLAEEHELPIPSWTEGPRYFSKEPCYALGTKRPEYQAFLRETTPYQFSRRNAYVGNNPLARC